METEDDINEVAQKLLEKCPTGIFFVFVFTRNIETVLIFKPFFVALFLNSFYLNF